MTRVVEILVAVNAALGIVTWLSVRWAARRKRQRLPPMTGPGPRQLPPAPPPPDDERRSD